LQRVGIALGNEMRDALVIAERRAEVAVEHAFPIMDVLFGEGGVESVGVTNGSDIGGWRAFAEYLLDGISRDQVD